MHTAIVGTRDPEHMLANIDAVETQLPLADETVADLHERYDRIGREWRGID
jgi:aryl-alcohol dehydrogenase-like predicted oxidoreductase